MVVAVTPAPDGSIQIASDVILVGEVAAYNADGSRFAFTARPADGSAGPNVYVWDTSDTEARAVTTDGRSILAGWEGSDLPSSRVVGDRPHHRREPAERQGDDEHGNDAWLPAASRPTASMPCGGTAASVSPPMGSTCNPGKGRLVIDSWPDGGDDAQVVERGAGTEWTSAGLRTARSSRCGWPGRAPVMRVASACSRSTRRPGVEPGRAAARERACVRGVLPRDGPARLHGAR